MVVVASAIVLVVVLVLEFLGRGKRTDCQQRSKIENEYDMVKLNRFQGVETGRRGAREPPAV